MVRLFRVMLPNTPMWRAMPRAAVPEVESMTNEEVVQSVELASHWKDPIASTCPAPESDDWDNNNTLDLFLGQESEGSWGTGVNAVDNSVTGPGGLQQATSRIQIDGNDSELRAVRFETPTSPSSLRLDNGSAQKPIVIDDSDDE